MCVCMLLCRVRLFAAPWTVARQASLFMGFSRQEYSSGLPFPSTGDFPNPGTEPRSPILQVDSLPSEPPGKPRGLLSQPQIILAFPSGAFSSGPASFPFVTLRHSYGHQHFCHAPIFQAQNFQGSKHRVGSEGADRTRLV